jgi:hypothetical protein
MPMDLRFRLNYFASLLFACPISLSVLSDSQPTRVSVIPVAHSQLGSGVAVKFRLTRSELGAACGSRIVQPRGRRRLEPLDAGLAHHPGRGIVRLFGGQGFRGSLGSGW